TGEPPAHRLDRRLLAKAEGVDEAQRLRLQRQHLVQRAARLAKRQVERGRLERPAPHTQRGVPLRRLRPEREPGQVLAEAGQRPLARERQLGPGLVQRRAVLAERRDVLAEPLPLAADEPYPRREAVELRG